MSGSQEGEVDRMQEDLLALIEASDKENKARVERMKRKSSGEEADPRDIGYILPTDKQIRDAFRGTIPDEAELQAAIGMVREYGIVNPFKGTEEELDRELNLVIGLVNLHRMRPE